MAELVDAPDSKSGDHTDREGSSPSSGTMEPTQTESSTIEITLYDPSSSYQHRFFHKLGEACFPMITQTKKHYAAIKRKGGVVTPTGFGTQDGNEAKPSIGWQLSGYPTSDSDGLTYNIIFNDMPVGTTEVLQGLVKEIPSLIESHKLPRDMTYDTTPEGQRLVEMFDPETIKGTWESLMKNLNNSPS